MKGDPDMTTTLPPVCASRHPSTGKTIFIRAGVKGYWEASEHTDPNEFNRDANLTPRQVAAMEVGSLFGFDVPGADPNHSMWDRLGGYYPYRGGKRA